MKYSIFYILNTLFLCIYNKGFRLCSIQNR